MPRRPRLSRPRMPPPWTRPQGSAPPPPTRRRWPTRPTASTSRPATGSRWHSCRAPGTPGRSTADRRSRSPTDERPVATWRSPPRARAGPPSAPASARSAPRCRPWRPPPIPRRPRIGPPPPWLPAPTRRPPAPTRWPPAPTRWLPARTRLGSGRPDAGPCRRARRRPRPRGRQRRVPGTPDRARGRRRRSRRAPPPGLRLPALLGAGRGTDLAQLRRPLHHRVLLGRGRRCRQPAQEERRRYRDDGLGRLVQLEHDRGDLGGSPARHARGADPLRVRMDHLAGRRPEGPAGQRGRAAQLRQAGGGRRPRPRRRRGQPRLRARGERLRGRVRRPPEDRPRGAQQRPRRVPGHLRHHGLDRQLPARGVGRGRGSGRDLHHGLRLPDRHIVLRRVHGPAVRTRVRPRRHGPLLHGARPRVADHPRPPVVRPRLVDGVGRRPRPDPDRRAVRLQHGRQLRERRGPGRDLGPPVGRRRAEPVHRVSPPELHGHLRLRHELATGLLRRRRLDEAPLRARQRLRAARRRTVGARVRRRPLGAVPRAVGVVPRGQERAAGRDQDARRHAARRGIRRHLGGPRRQRGRVLRRAGFRGRRRLDRLAHGDRGDLRGLAGPRRTRIRVPGASQGRHRESRAVERDGDVAGHAGARGRWLRPRPGGRPRLSHRTRGGRDEARHHAGQHDRRDHQRAGRRRRLHLVGGHPAGPRVVAGDVRGTRRVGRLAVGHDHLPDRMPGAEQHPRRRGPVRLRPRAAARPGRGSRRHRSPAAPSRPMATEPGTPSRSGGRTPSP